MLLGCFYSFNLDLKNNARFNSALVQLLNIKPVTADETYYRIFKLIETQPHITQRQLAQALGISLGKVNYCLRALIEKGLVKARNFRRNPNKKTYVYLLTPKGIDEKTELTVRFLKCKMLEYKHLEQEIEQLRSEAGRELVAVDTLLAENLVNE
jgi:EPS-associated MarR family transcriptional regulator